MEDRSDLLVFIDLGFVLLVGFLILTETAPRVNVVLPEEVKNTTAPEEELNVLNLRFDGSSNFTVDDGKDIICDSEGLVELASCMNKQIDATFVLIPEGSAPVQYLVTLLDLCKRHNQTCAVPN